MREGGGFLFVKYRGNFIYICKRHHLEYCKPPTPRRATLGCAPDSPQSGPGVGSHRLEGKRHGLYTKREAEVEGLQQFLLRPFGKRLPKPLLNKYRLSLRPSHSSPGRVGRQTFLGTCNAICFRRVFRSCGKRHSQGNAQLQILVIQPQHPQVC